MANGLPSLTSDANDWVSQPYSMSVGGEGGDTMEVPQWFSPSLNMVTPYDPATGMDASGLYQRNTPQWYDQQNGAGSYAALQQQYPGVDFWRAWNEGDAMASAQDEVATAGDFIESGGLAKSLAFLGAGLGGAEALGFGAGSGMGGGAGVMGLGTDMTLGAGALGALESTPAMMAGTGLVSGTGTLMPPATPPNGAGYSAAPFGSETAGATLHTLTDPAAAAAGMGLPPMGTGGLGFDPSQLPKPSMPSGGQGATPGTPGAAPAPGAPGSAATAPAAPSVPGTAPQGATGIPFVDDLIRQMRANPLQALGLGMTAASLAGGAGSQKTPPAVGQLNQLGTDAQATAQRLIQQHASGQLSGPQQASLDQTVQNTKNQIRQYFANIGMSDSTAARQAEAAVEREALAMKQEFLNQSLTQGLNALGIATGPLSQAAQFTLGQDKNLQQAFGQFGQAIGNLFGRNAATTQTKPAGT